MTGTAASTDLSLILRNLFQEPIVDHPVHPVTRELSYIILFSRFKLCSHVNTSSRRVKAESESAVRLDVLQL